MIKHVSFDVWNTLVTPNPQFAALRTNFLAIALNLDPDFVRIGYTAVKHAVDSAAEQQNGKAYSTTEVYQLLFDKLNVKVSDLLAAELRANVDDIFLQYPPTIEHSTIELMDWLRTKRISVSIASNSNFISGTVMHPFLLATVLDTFTKDGQLPFGIYSDQLKLAKPGDEFFNQVVTAVRDKPVTSSSTHVEMRSQILHVGDNQICDIQGAREAGIHSLLIQSPTTLFDQVKSRVELENVHLMNLDVELYYPHVITTSQYA